MKHEYASAIDDVNQKRIERTTLLIVGDGAIGSNVAVSAAHAGIRSIKVVDPDVLEEHNLENQLYTMDDIGLPKVEAIAKVIKKIDPTIEVIPIQKPIQEATVEELTADIYLSCVDSFGARFYINNIASTHMIPMIDAGIRGFSITVRTIIPKETPCLECWPDLIPGTDPLASCSKKKIPSIFTTAQVAAGLQMAEVFKIIHGWPTVPYQAMDLKAGTFGKIQLERNLECPLCSTDWSSVDWKEEG